MQWMAENYKWIFDGVGAGLLLLLLGWLYKKRSAKQKNTNTSLTATDSQVSSSPVTSGSGNITNMNVVNLHPPPTPDPIASPTAPTPLDRLNPNIQMTGAFVLHVRERDEVWREVVDSGEQAIVIQFTNEVRQEGRNVGGPVKASLVYRTAGQSDLRIIGSWLDQASDYTEFQVLDSRKLIVGIKYPHNFTAIERHRVTDRGFTNVTPVPHYLRVMEKFAVRIELINANTGDLLYEREFWVTLDPLQIGIIPKVVGQGRIMS